MQIIATEVREGNGMNAGFTVDFIGDGGERISVGMTQNASGSLTYDNAVQKAQVILLQAVSSTVSGQGRSIDPAKTSEAVKSLRLESQDHNRAGSALQEGLEDSFPASDPISATYTSTAGSELKH